MADRTSGNVPAEGFDPTNNLVDGLTGDSDGTAESDTASAAERGGETGDEATRNSGAAPAEGTAGGYPANMP